MSAAQLAGITPYVLRLASYYASLGIGEYRPKGYSNFDKVLVRELMPWSPEGTTSVLVVEFFLGTLRKRYVEFALTVSGFGGEPIVKALD